jgi:quercetin 2,3-dioxygenase
MKITIFAADQQGTGEFDGGKITEQKPIAFPHEHTAVKRVGPLFYWAWGFTKNGGLIPFHHHQAFEIMSYVINGNVAHRDTLGTSSVVGPGGAQVMQTGTGMNHEEKSFGTDIEGFQIWFEPYLKEAVKMAPTYQEIMHDHFPIVEKEGILVKSVIGEGSPISLVTDVKMWDISQKPSKNHTHTIPNGYSVALLMIRGNGSIIDSTKGQITPLHHKDFVVIDAEEIESEVIFQSQDEGVRFIIIQVPTKVDYPLYDK